MINSAEFFLEVTPQLLAQLLNGRNPFRFELLI